MNDIARISMISCKQAKTFCECERAENRDDIKRSTQLRTLLKRVVDMKNSGPYRS